MANGQINTRIDHDQLQADLNKGKFVTIRVYDENLTVTAQYGKYNLLGSETTRPKTFDTFYEMCSRLCFFSEEAIVVHVDNSSFSDDEE